MSLFFRLLNLLSIPYAKKIIGLLILVGMVGISSGQTTDLPRQKLPDQIYIQVEAQKRLYNGGNVKYASYAPFKFNSLDNFLALPEGEPGHLAAIKWMKEQGIVKEQITDQHREDFMALVGEKYFSVVSKAINLIQYFDGE